MPSRASSESQTSRGWRTIWTGWTVYPISSRAEMVSPAKRVSLGSFITMTCASPYSASTIFANARL